LSIESIAFIFINFFALIVLFYRYNDVAKNLVGMDNCVNCVQRALFTSVINTGCARACKLPTFIQGFYVGLGLVMPLLD
jgi:hypothetical protein